MNFDQVMKAYYKDRDELGIGKRPALPFKLTRLQRLIYEAYMKPAEHGRVLRFTVVKTGRVPH